MPDRSGAEHPSLRNRITHHHVRPILDHNVCALVRESCPRVRRRAGWRPCMPVVVAVRGIGSPPFDL